MAKLVGWLELNVPFQQKYGFIRDWMAKLPNGVETLQKISTG